MFKISITPSFRREFKKLEEDLKIEVREKIELLQDKCYYEALKVHKLKGRLSGRYSFSINYKIRVVFDYLNKNEIILHAIGDHDVYKA